MKKRHGKKYFIKIVKEKKEYSFRDIMASWTLEVHFRIVGSEFLLKFIQPVLNQNDNFTKPASKY
jgi:hypothetical protein